MVGLDLKHHEYTVRAKCLILGLAKQALLENQEQASALLIFYFL